MFVHSRVELLDCPANILKSALTLQKIYNILQSTGEMMFHLLFFVGGHGLEFFPSVRDLLTAETSDRLASVAPFFHGSLCRYSSMSFQPTWCYVALDRWSSSEGEERFPWELDSGDRFMK